MIVLLFILIPVANVALTAAAWRLRGLLAEHEAAQLTVALGGAIDDWLEEYSLRCNAEFRAIVLEFRAIVLEERLREHGIEIA